MTVCPSCGTENPAAAKFCNECGARLRAPSALPEERKTVTTLICDLVGFTAMSEAADPEDIDRLLRVYFARATRAIESHGGTVEKFIGDAVVGVFGVPAVHEDDPERAVRAALRLLEALEDLTGPDGTPLLARCGVNTGEALVRLDVSPGSGAGFLTGDAVNTAARLQAAAPPGGVAVGALTRELTVRVIVYGELPAVLAKGKTGPVAAWRAIAPVARRGLDTDAAGLSVFVGREVELAYLSALFDKTVAQASPQFALLVGEPGIGKSRLVREMLTYVDARQDMTTWRQGCCPPFGEDVTFWALAEIVKGHAGILDTDGPAVIEDKLDGVLPPGPDQPWLRQRLRALVGLSAPEASREENFTAWVRFLEEVAADRPTVIVIEDLHWADQALLAFIEHLASHVASVPLLVVGTARPELFERQPDFASGGRINRIGLEPLTREEAARLVADLLGAQDRFTPIVERVVENCDGNPFYAEQSARLMEDATAHMALPDSVQAVIAARLDALPVAQKSLLADAAVVGAVFWDGSLAALAERETADLAPLLSGLLARRLIRRLRASSMEGEHEYEFAHALAREVAYQQLPRSARARRHQAVADWYARKTGARCDDLAAVLAYHSMTALDLAREAGDDDLAASIVESAVLRVVVAGERAVKLDVGAARRLFEWGLAAAGDRGLEAERGRLLTGLAEVTYEEGDLTSACELCTEAADLSGLAGDIANQALVKSWHAMTLDELCRPGGIELVREATELVAIVPPGRATIEVLTTDLWMRWARDERPEGVERAVGAIVDLADRLGEPAPVVAMMQVCMARLEMGDTQALRDLDEVVDLAMEAGLGRETCVVLGNRGVLTVCVEGPAEALRVDARAEEFAAHRGLRRQKDVSRSVRCEALILGGQWQAALELYEEFAPQLLESGDVWSLAQVRVQHAWMLSWMGDSAAARDHVGWVEDQVAESPMEWVRTNLVAGQAAVAHASGRSQEALALLGEWAQRLVWSTDASMTVFALTAVRIALALGGSELARDIAASRDSRLPLNAITSDHIAACMAEADRELDEAAAGFADAAQRWHDFGVPYEEGHALLGQGRCLVALGRAPEAAAPLAAARELFARLGAAPALAETEEWLARAKQLRGTV
jgi:class 3 adenylate cyclase